MVLERSQGPRVYSCPFPRLPHREVTSGALRDRTLFPGSLHGALPPRPGSPGIARRSGHRRPGSGALERGGEVRRVGDSFPGRPGNEGRDSTLGRSCPAAAGTERALTDSNLPSILVPASLRTGARGARRGPPAAGVRVAGLARAPVGGNGGNARAADAEASSCRCPPVGLSFHRSLASSATDKGGNVGRGGGKCGWSGKGHSVGRHSAPASSFASSAA